MSSTTEIMENQNVKVRRRNVSDNANNSSKLPCSTEFLDETLKSCTDSDKAWRDGVVPELPCINLKNEEPSMGTSLDVEHMKIAVIVGTIAKANLTFGELKLLSCSSQGLVNDDIRRVLWPRLLGLPNEKPPVVNDLEKIHTSIPVNVYEQILKDVARSGGHLPENSTEEETDKFQDELIQIMCWVLSKHPHLNYYQGYNDIAATVLIVMGLQMGLHVLEQLSLQFFERFMEKTMEQVNQELFYIFALLDREHPTLLQHLENVELFPHFALAEYTTWYAHKFSENRKLLHRLFDFFLGSPPLTPLYLSTVIVAYRDTEIFNTTPDMGHTHKVLSTLPDDLPFEKLLVDAKTLYRQYPPESISNAVRDFDQKKRNKELEWKAKVDQTRLERERRRNLMVVPKHPTIRERFSSYKTITVVILALGLFAFYRTSSTLN